MDEDEEEEHRDQAREPKEYTMTIKYVQPIETDKMLRYVTCSARSLPAPSLLFLWRCQCSEDPVHGSATPLLMPPAPQMLLPPSRRSLHISVRSHRCACPSADCFVHEVI